MKRLILHGGGPKTGSSFLQVLLAQHTAALADRNILVPAGRESDKAANGMISSGNGLELANYLDPNLKHLGDDADRDAVLSGLAQLMRTTQCHTIVFSSEFLVLKPNAQSQTLLEICKEAGYEIIFVLYVRSYSDAAYSFYSQSVKRHNDTRSFSEFIQGFDPVYMQRIAQVAEVLPKTAIQVLNYDSLADGLGAQFFTSILGVDLELGTLPAVNRSLTFDELEIVRYMNRFFPKNNAYSTYVSDAILYNTAHKSDYEFVLETNEVALMTQRFETQIQNINSWLPDDPIHIIAPACKIGNRASGALSTMDEIQLAIMTQIVKQQVSELQQKKALNPPVFPRG